MTVAELIARLEQIKDKSREVQAWLPGSYMPVDSVIDISVKPIMLEVHVPEGSALDAALAADAHLTR
jgi:hypothetical protein